MVLTGAKQDSRSCGGCVEFGVGVTVHGLRRIPLRRSVSSISLRLSKLALTSTSSSPAKVVDGSCIRNGAKQVLDHNLKTPPKKNLHSNVNFFPILYLFIFCSGITGTHTCFDIFPLSAIFVEVYYMMAYVVCLMAFG
jgi:hypothetical protein